MISAIVAGLLSAVIVLVPPLVQGRFSGAFSPMMVVGVAGLAMVLQRFVLDRRQGHRNYDGMADLFVHIHSPSTPDTALRWGVRGFISLLLSICGGEAGPEGAAAELAHSLALATRPRSARWFDQRRRTDAAVSLATAVSAALGAPFAGVMLPLELGMGGRAILSVVGALVAYAVGRMLRGWLGLGLPDFSGAVSGVSVIDVRLWMAAVLLGLAGGVFGAVLVRFFRYAQDSLLDLFQTQAWMRTFCAGVLLFLVVLTYRPAHAPSAALFEHAIRGGFSPMQAGLSLLAGALSLSMVLAGFGTVGVFWPVLALGGFFGAGFGTVALSWLGTSVAAVGFLGGAAFWGAMLGAPVAGAVLAFELTHGVGIVLPCLVAGAIAQRVRRSLGARPVIHNDLEARGLGLLEGRSAGVLSALYVRDAMVSDHETISEQESVSAIYPRLIKSRYPFLPVVNSQNAYTGLLTIDLIQEAWRAQSEHSNSPLSKLLEAKDLLYRSGLKTPTLKADDRLSAAAGVFDTVPCVAVLSDDGRVAGLLFVHNVRLTYDREMARRSLEE